MSSPFVSGTLDDLEKLGIVFLGTKAPDPRLETKDRIWLRCRICGYSWAVSRSLTADSNWTKCHRPEGCSKRVS